MAGQDLEGRVLTADERADAKDNTGKPVSKQDQKKASTESKFYDLAWFFIRRAFIKKITGKTRFFLQHKNSLYLSELCR